MYKPHFPWDGMGQVGSGAFPPKVVQSVPKKPAVPLWGCLSMWSQADPVLLSTLGEAELDTAVR